MKKDSEDSDSDEMKDVNMVKEDSYLDKIVDVNMVKEDSDSDKIVDVNMVKDDLDSDEILDADMVKDSYLDEILDADMVNEHSYLDKIADVHMVNDQLKKLQKKLLLEKERLYGKMMNLKEQTKENQSLISNLENFGLQDEMPHLDFLETHQWPDSPKASPIHEPQNLSDNSFEILDFPPIQAGSSKQSDVTLSQTETKLHETTTEINDSSTPSTSQNTSDNASQSVRTDAKSKAQHSVTNSEEDHDGKGKGAANPKYRYKKRSKPEASTMEIASQEKPVTPAKGATGRKIFQSQSPKVDVTRISPAVKRKELASDEGCSSWTSTFPGSTSNDTDDLKVAKKLKFDGEKTRNLSSTVSTFRFQKDCKSYDSSQNADQSKTDQGLNEKEQLKLPSSRGLSSYPSSSEESFSFSENEFREIKMPTLSSRSGDVTRLERQESSTSSRRSSVASLQRQESFPFSENERRERKVSTLSSISDDLTYGEKESSIIHRRYSVTSLQRQESSQSTASFCVPSSDRAESSLASLSDDAMFRDIESPLPILPPIEIEESSLTSVNAVVPVSQMRETFLTNVSDLSELIATTSYEQCDPSQVVDQSQIGRSHNESEQLNLPSTSGLSKMVSHTSFSKDASRISGKNDVTYSAGKQSSLTSSSEDVTGSERELSLTSGGEDTCSTCPVTCSTCEERMDSNSSNDFMLSDEESTLKLEESFRTNASDLSELITNASDEGSPSEAEGS